MKKWLKILSGIVVVAVCLVVVLIVLAKVLITPERVKGALLPLAEDHLHRKIDVGDIEVSLFSGIEIHGLTLYEKDGTDIFMSTAMVRLKYQLLPLLALKVVVDEVRLEKPTIRIVRLRDGQFNFSDLTNSKNSVEKPLGASKNESSAGEQGETPINLLVSNLLLQDGQLTFLDHVLNDKAPYRYEVTDLQVAAKGVSLSGEVPLSLQCQLNGSPLTVAGKVNLQPLGGDFEINLQNLDAVAFSPYIKDALPGKLGGMLMTLSSTLSGTPDQVALKGKLSLAELDLLLNALPDAPLENARLDVDYDLLVAPNQEQLQINRFDLDFNGIKLGSKGTVAALLSKPRLDISLAVPELKIREAVTAIPKNLVGDVGSLDPAGTLTAQASLAGTLDEPAAILRSASIEMKDVQATAGEHRPAFSGRLVLAGEQANSEGLQVRLGDNKADIKLIAKRIFSKQVIVNADIASERFLLEPLLQGSATPVVAADTPPSGTGKKVDASEDIGPFDIPVQASGTISVAEALWKGLTIRDFVARYELKDNVLNVSRMDGQVAGGTFSNSARVDLGKKGLAYSAKLGMQKIQADPLLTAFLPKSAGSLLGTMDLAVALSGRGTEWQALSRNLSGDGNVLVADGRLTSPALVNGLSSFLQLSELNDIRFDNFKGQFKIVDGKVKLESQILSNTIKLFPKGSVGLDGSLDLGLDTRLSPELSARLDRKGGVARYLADKDGWTRMPLLLKGDFSSPRFGLDPKGVQGQASQAISNELGRQLDRLFKTKDSQPDSGNQPESGSGPAEESGRKILQDSLQKLFGN